MAAPDCGFCEASGYRACDRCGNPVFDVTEPSALGFDLCVYCRES